MKMMTRAISILLLILSSHHSFAKSKQCSQVYDDSQFEKIQSLYDLLRQDYLADLSKESIHDQLEFELSIYSKQSGRSIEEIIQNLDRIEGLVNRKETEQRAENIRTNEERAYDPLVVLEEFGIPLEKYFNSYSVSGTTVVLFYYNAGLKVASPKKMFSKIAVYDLLSRKVVFEMPVTTTANAGRVIMGGKFYLLQTDQKKAVQVRSIVYDLKTKKPIFRQKMKLSHKRQSSETFLLFDRYDLTENIIHSRTIFNPHNKKRLVHHGDHVVTNDYALVAHYKKDAHKGDIVSLYDKELTKLKTFDLPAVFVDGFVLSQKNQVVLIDNNGIFRIFDMTTGELLDEKQSVTGNFRFHHIISPNQTHILLTRHDDQKAVYYYNSDTKVISRTKESNLSLLGDNGPYPLSAKVISYKRFKETIFGFAWLRLSMVGLAQPALINFETGEVVKEISGTYFLHSDDGSYIIKLVRPQNNASPLQVQVYGAR